MLPFSARPAIRPFYLYRTVDRSGVSGTGLVAVGVLLPSGRAVLEWCSRWRTITVFESIDHIVRIHGHGGHTVLRWGVPVETTRGLVRPGLREIARRRGAGLTRWIGTAAAWIIAGTQSLEAGSGEPRPEPGPVLLSLAALPQARGAGAHHRRVRT